MEKINMFSDIVNKYTSSLYDRATYLISNTEDAEDLVQDVFISAYETFENFKGNSSIKTWLMGILKNKAADYYRKKYKKSTPISLDHFFEENGYWKEEHRLEKWPITEDTLFSDVEFQEIFTKCLDHLPDKWNIPFKMYYLEEKKTELLSQELGLTATNIWKILQRGRLQLKECLEKNWFNER